jgi:hypothetical protein
VSQQITLGALLTAAGAFVTVGLAWTLGVGRFKALGNLPHRAEKSPA